MKQATLLNTLRIKHYTPAIPSLEVIVQTLESNNVPQEAINLATTNIIRSHNAKRVTFSHIVEVAQALQECANVVEVSCKAHEKVVGCGKQGSLITSLEEGKIKGRDINLFWHQFSLALMEDTKATTKVKVDGALVRHLLTVDSEWFPE
ncbi:hypothetical protein [Pseudomonas sp.]|uniref:hypothetical protein n=1 Tax=Pseudomonas sp. TaxID=306 RepID=UPI002FCC63C2